MKWFVVTPQYETVLEIICDGQGPVGMVADVVEVETETRRDAIALGVAWMLRQRSRDYRWCRGQRADGLSPYAGVRAIAEERAE